RIVVAELPREILRGVIDDDIRAEAFDEGPTTRRRRRRDGRPEVFRQLKRERPDAARAAWNEDAHAFLDCKLVAKGLKRGERRERDGSCMDEVERGWLFRNEIFVDARRLGESAET